MTSMQPISAGEPSMPVLDLPGSSRRLNHKASDGRVRAATLAVALMLPNGAWAADEQGAEGQKAPPPSVVVAPVDVKPVAKERRYIGTIKAIQSVELKARVEGFLEKVEFEQGRMVDAGQILYQIEQAPFQASLVSAEGQLAAAKAQKASAEATLEDKQADFERQQTLVKRGDTSQTDFDRAKAARDEAKAAVEEASASIQQAEAAVDTARINLGYTVMRSPIKGRIGATNFTQGNLVNGSSGTLSTVVQLDPIRAVFSIPSADYVRFQQTVVGEGTEDARELFVPRLVLPTGEVYKETGKVAFADNQVNASTGTIAVYADFPNPDYVLVPGQFVTALVSTAEQQPEPVVPAAAIQRTREGQQVYVVGKDNTIEQKTIKTGVQVGSGYAVTSGLQGGETVVVSGVQKVKPGMQVKPVSQSDAPPMGRSLDIGSGAEGDAKAGDGAASGSDGVATDGAKAGDGSDTAAKQSSSADADASEGSGASAASGAASEANGNASDGANQGAAAANGSSN